MSWTLGFLNSKQNPVKIQSFQSDDSIVFKLGVIWLELPMVENPHYFDVLKTWHLWSLFLDSTTDCFFFLYILIFFFIIPDLQCSVNFLLYSMVTQLHIHVQILFSHIIIPIINDWILFPVLHSRISLLIHSKGQSPHLLTPSSQSIRPPPLSIMSTRSLFCKSMVFFSVERFICAVC